MTFKGKKYGPADAGCFANEMEHGARKRLAGLLYEAFFDPKTEAWADALTRDLHIALRFDRPATRWDERVALVILNRYVCEPAVFFDIMDGRLHLIPLEQEGMAELCDS